MAVTTPKNMNELQKATAAPPVQESKNKGVIEWLQGDNFRNQLAMALPKFLDCDRFVRSAISEFRLNPALKECSVPSVLGFYMQAAMCGLEPSSVLGQCYPVPFWNNKTKQRECQFILSYRGMLSIARRSGDILSIDAQIVHEKDEFILTYGLDQILEHRPDLSDDPGPMIGAYCIVRFKDGGYQYKFMPRSEIEAHRRRSKATGFSPWQTDYEEMAKKTVFRSLFKWLPISIEQATQIGADTAVVNYSAPAADVTNIDETIEINFAQDDGEVEQVET